MGDVESKLFAGTAMVNGGEEWVEKVAWPFPVKLLEVQHDPSFEIVAIYAGPREYRQRKSWEGDLIPEDMEVVARFKNISEEPLAVRGVWFFENVAKSVKVVDPPQRVSKPAPPPPPPPPPEHALPKPPTSSYVQSTMYMQPSAPPPAAPPPVVPLPFIPPPSSPPPAPEVPLTPLEAPPPPVAPMDASASPTEPSLPEQVPPTAQIALTATPQPGLNEVTLFLTREQCRRILFVLKGGMAHPLEYAGLAYPFEKAVGNLP